MKIKKLICKYIPFIPMLAILAGFGMLGACNSDIPVSDTADILDINVSFRISTSNSASTRGIITEQFGAPLENRIDVTDLKILLFDNTDTEQRLLEILYDNGVEASNARLTSLGYGDYMLDVKLDPNIYSRDSKFVVVAMANWDSLRESALDIELEKGVTPLERIFKYTYFLNRDPENGENDLTTWMPEENSLIPMFGLLNGTLANYSSDLFGPSNPMELGVVNMLRSVVKIEVVDNSVGSLAEIESVSLNRRNTRGYLTHWKGSGENTGQVTSSYIPSEVGVENPAGYSSRPINFMKDGNKYIAYIPEFYLGEENSLSTRQYIDVKLRYKGIAEVRHIFLAPYDAEGNPYIPRSGWDNEWKSLLRNHIYRFVINSINVNPNLGITVDVQPFSNVQLPVDFGLERTEDGYIVVRDAQGNVIKYIRTDGSILTLSKDTDWPEIGEFTGVFDSWKRVLIGYFADGRRIIFNYEGDDPDEAKLLSWEIYASSKYSANAKIEETFSFKNLTNQGSDESSSNNSVITPAFTHSLLDANGRLISQMVFKSRDHFRRYRLNPTATESPAVRVSYTGDRDGDKRISYFGTDGKIYCQIIVVGNTENYIYDNFIYE